MQLEEYAVDAVKVYLAVKTLKGGKSTGCDEIQPENLKTSIDKELFD